MLFYFRSSAITPDKIAAMRVRLSEMIIRSLH